MIDEKKLANAAMNNEELDSVDGGRIGETADTGRFETYTDSSGNPISREEAFNIVREKFSQK